MTPRQLLGGVGTPTPAPLVRMQLVGAPSVGLGWQHVVPWRGAFLGSLASVQKGPDREGVESLHSPGPACMTLLSPRGRKLTPQGQRDLDRIAGQVRPGCRLGLGPSVTVWVFPKLPSDQNFLPWKAQPRLVGVRGGFPGECAGEGI